jgi:hypothetical protein
VIHLTELLKPALAASSHFGVVHVDGDSDKSEKCVKKNAGIASV